MYVCTNLMPMPSIGPGPQPGRVLADLVALASHAVHIRDGTVDVPAATHGNGRQRPGGGREPSDRGDSAARPRASHLVSESVLRGDPPRSAVPRVSGSFDVACTALTFFWLQRCKKYARECCAEVKVISVDKSNVESTSQIGRELAGATQSALAASGLAGLGGGADSPIPSTSSGQPSTKRQKTNKLVM